MKNLIELPATEKEIKSTDKEQAVNEHSNQRTVMTALPKRALPKRRINPRLLIL